MAFGNGVLALAKQSWRGCTPRQEDQSLAPGFRCRVRLRRAAAVPRAAGPDRPRAVASRQTGASLAAAPCRRKDRPPALRSMRCEATRSGVGSSHPAHHEWRSADFGRVVKSRWDGVEANCRTLEGMARPAGSAGAQGAAAAGVGRGDVGSPSAVSRQEARSFTYGGLDKHQALIAPAPSRTGPDRRSAVIAPGLCQPRAIRLRSAPKHARAAETRVLAMDDQRQRRGRRRLRDRARSSAQVALEATPG